MSWAAATGSSADGTQEPVRQAEPGAALEPTLEPLAVRIAQLAAFAVAVTGSVILSNALSFAAAGRTWEPYWLASGVGAGVVCCVSRRWRPAFLVVLAGAVTAGVWLAGGGGAAGVSPSAAAVVEAIVFALVSHRVWPDIRLLVRQSSVVRLVLLAVVCGMVGASVILGLGPELGGATSSSIRGWLVAAVAHALGIMSVAPLVLVWPSIRAIGARRALELTGAGAVLVTSVEVGFDPRLLSGLAFPYVPLAVLLVAVVRLGRVGAASLSPALAVLAVWQTGLGHGPWAHAGSQSLSAVLATQAYAATALTVPWLIAGLMGERDRAQTELIGGYHRLEAEVLHRTARLAEQTRHAQVAASVSQALSEARLDEATAMQAVARVVAGAFGDLGALFTLADDGRLVVAAIHGDDEQLAQALRVVSAPLRFSASTEGFAGRALATGQVVRVSGGAEQWANAAHPASREFFVRWRIHGFMVAPMRAHGEVVGALSVFRRETPGEFDDHHARFLQELADRAGLALANARLHAQVAEQAAENARLLTAEREARLALRESEQKRRAVLASMLEAEEAERTRIATALHDDTVQVLAASLIALDRLPGAATKGNAERVTTEARATLAEATERTRRLMFELRPTVLHDYGVVAATRVLLDETARETAAATRLTGEVGRYHLVLEEAVYRGVQEALTNIRKHARATAIEVAFEEHSGQLVCDVVDNGRGFDLEEARSRPNAPLHMGLSHIVERVRAAGGDMHLASAPGQGTHVRLTVPVERRTSPERRG